jgi:hypothetical protein
MAGFLYRFFNRKTEEWREIRAWGKDHAIAIYGEEASNCDITVKTDRGGWAKVKKDKK